MTTLVVYESLWGNTAAIARAIAEGIGADARALSTADATPELVASARLIVAGAPLLGFTLPTGGMRATIGKGEPKAPTRPDLSHPSMRTCFATFETRIWWSPGSAAKNMAKLLAARGLKPVAAPQKFVVTGRYGPLKDGEIERARQWGAGLAR
jgi:flavodoxin